MLKLLRVTRLRKKVIRNNKRPLGGNPEAIAHLTTPAKMELKCYIMI